MPKYLVLYRAPGDAMEQMAGGTPEQAQEGMQLWMKWAERTGSALTDLGSPLGKSEFVPAGSDGAAGTPIGGFSIVEAKSPAAANDLLDDHPHLHMPGGVIEVLEFLPIPGM